MIVESNVYSNNHPKKLKIKQYSMAMSKLTIKQNGHSSTNENRTDDDYGGGGNDDNNNSQISS